MGKTAKYFAKHPDYVETTLDYEQYKAYAKVCGADKPGFSHTAWDALLESSIASIKALQSVKGGEYATDSDRLANFRTAAQLLDLPMTNIWAVYAFKHFAAILNFCQDQRKETSRPSSEPITGRIDDLIVYCMLLKAILEDQSNGQ